MRLILTVDNSYCHIEGLNLDQFRSLREVLSYASDAQASYFSGNHKTSKKYLLDKKGNFPSGLLYLVKKYLKNNQLNYTVKNLKIVPLPLNERLSLRLGVTPYLAQSDALKAALLKKHGTIVLPTGCGKSLTMALLINALQVKTLIIVPTLHLKRQLQESMKAWFGSLEHISIENIDSPTLDKKTNYGCLIIDEAHHSAARTYRRLNKTAWTGIYYRYHFTATPFRARDEEQLLYESIAGPVIYRLEYKDAISQGLICPIDAFYIDMPKERTEGYTWAEVYKERVVGHSHRNNAIAGILKRLDSDGKSTLCIVKEVAHGEELRRLTGAAFAHGTNEETPQLIDWFSSYRLKTLIGTSGVVGEGIDTRAAEYIVIAGLGKSKNAFMQQIGRGVRRFGDKESAKIIIFRDPSHKFTLRHFNAQRKILLEEYNCIVVKLNI